MIEKIKLKISSSDERLIELDIGTITVLVGPNNSGKSKMLQEISHFCNTGFKHNDVIIDNIIFKNIDNSNLDQVLKDNTYKIPKNNNIFREGYNSNHIGIGHEHTSTYIDRGQLKNMLLNPNNDTKQYCKYYQQCKTIFLGGKDRTNNICMQQPMGNMHKPPRSSFGILFYNDDKRSKLQDILYDAFNKYLIIDTTSASGNYKISYSDIAPKIGQEKSLENANIRFQETAEPISSMSDGVKAYTAILTEIVAGDHDTLLIDEPEAFLHPTLSFKLGNEVSKIMQHSGKQLFVATHSEYFLMGCIQSGIEIEIIRLNYKNNIPSATIIPKFEISKMMHDPMLRSTRIIASLFYDAVVVTEGDSDRAFYEEVNRRLLDFPDASSNKGIDNCLFINAHSKHTIEKIVKPLRSFGIPVAAVVDLDILLDGWKKIKDSLYFDTISETGFKATIDGLKNQFKQILKETYANLNDEQFQKELKKTIKEKGITFFDANNQIPLKQLYNNLAEYGLFIVINGELESWLKKLGVNVQKSQWLSAIFDEMGSNPRADSYVRPTEDDVWEFINKISKWFNSPTRKGMPNIIQ